MNPTIAPTPAKEGADFDARVVEMMRWHFDELTGSPFWLERAPSLGFDPTTDVRGAADLLKFPDFSEDLRNVPIQDLIPGGRPAKEYHVYESGGTSGAPKRIVDRLFRSRMLAWAHERLAQQGVKSPAHWLHLGPSGPHVFGFDCATYARLSDGTFYTVDFDPRWVKKLIANGQSDVVEAYVAHLLDQMRDILQSQPVRVLSTTPPLVEAICGRPELYELVRSKVEAIIWAGTSFSAESLRQVDEVFFPETSIIGIYGNTLMGVAPQRPSQPDDPSGCVFEPYPGAVRVELVDDEGNLVDFGARGRVRLHVVSEDMFLPNVLERDTATRVRPSVLGGPDGLADVRTLQTLGQTRIIEGVY